AKGKKTLRVVQEFVANKLGLDSAKELEVYPRGTATFFLSLAPPAKKGGDPEPSVGVVMDMGEDIDRLKSLVKKIVRKALDKGARKETKEVAGIEVTTIHFKKDDTDGDQAPGGPDPDVMALVQDIVEALELDQMQAMGLNQAAAMARFSPPDQFAFAYSGSVFILASDARTAQQTARRIKDGAENSFAGDAAMRSLKRHCAPKADMQFVVNLPRLMALIREADSEAAKGAKAIGLGSFGAFVSTLEFAPSGEIDGHIRGFLEIKGNAVGLAKLLMMPNRRTAPPASISADVAIFANANIDPSAILSEVVEIVARINPDAGEKLRAGMKFPQADGSTLDIQKDIIGFMTGPLFGGLLLSSPYDNDHVGAIIVLGHKSREAMEKLLAMIPIPPGILVPREMMGNTIYDVSVIPGLSIGVTDKVLIVLGTQPAIDSYLRGETRAGGGLAESPEFKRALRHVASESNVMLFFDGKRLFDAQLAIQKAGDVAEMPQFMAAPAGAFLRYALLQDFIGNKIEDAKALRKYQTSGIFTMSKQADGLRFDAVTLTGSSD
ncbi:MAG: hypothetical protein IIB54_16425, partial [Planctomycetes bacterium]|nr:hypothetical protein [Planctomycetota bacterium]